MTVANGINENIFIGNGSSDEFIFTFPALEQSWVYGSVNNVLQAATVVLNPDQESNAGGSLLFATAPADGSLVRVFRDVPQDQLLDLPDYTPFPSRNVENALDKLTMAAAQKVDSEKGGDINGDVGFSGNLIVKRSGALIFASQTGEITPDENGVYLFDTSNGNLQLSVSDGEGSFIPVVLVTAEEANFLQPLKSQAFPSAPSSVTNKDYVDQGLNDKISRLGDTMLGALNVPDEPASGRAAVNRTYVEEVISSIFDGLQFKGFYDASSGQLPPDTTNGDFYILAVGGTLDVSDGINPPVATPLAQGDKIVYSESIAAWIGLSSGSSTATSTAFTATGNYTATDVQAALEEADNSLFAHASGGVEETLTGVKTFDDDVNISFGASFILQESDAGTTGVDNFQWVNNNGLYLQKDVLGGGGWRTVYQFAPAGAHVFYDNDTNVTAQIGLQGQSASSPYTIMTREKADFYYAGWFSTEAAAQADTTGRVVFADAGS